MSQPGSDSSRGRTRTALVEMFTHARFVEEKIYTRNGLLVFVDRCSRKIPQEEYKMYMRDLYWDLVIIY